MARLQVEASENIYLVSPLTCFSTHNKPIKPEWKMHLFQGTLNQKQKIKLFRCQFYENRVWVLWGRPENSKVQVIIEKLENPTKFLEVNSFPVFLSLYCITSMLDSFWDWNFRLHIYNKMLQNSSQNHLHINFCFTLIIDQNQHLRG